MKRKNFRRLLSLVAATFVLFAYTNCGSNAIFSTPRNNEETYEGGSTVGNPPKYTFAVAGYTENVRIELCIEQLRLEPAVNPPQTYVAMMTPYEWPAAGGNLPVSSDLEGLVYTKIFLELEDRCGGGYGIRVTNSFGTFVATGIDMMFLGSIDSSAPSGRISLTLGAISQGLEGVTSDQLLADAINARWGSF